MRNTQVKLHFSLIINYIINLKKMTSNAMLYILQKTMGATLASTWVTKPEVHAEDTDSLANPSVTLIVANDDNYALAA